MHQINVKPLSVNQCWKGRRYKTDKYKGYAYKCKLLLPKSIDIPEGPLAVHYKFYVSNAGADYDNPIKPFQDIICEKYGIDDKQFYMAVDEKIVVPKGCEKIEFAITNWE